MGSGPNPIKQIRNHLQERREKCSQSFRILAVKANIGINGYRKVRKDEVNGRASKISYA